jgi:competence protein ComEA
MPEILVTDSWPDRIRELIGRRRDGWVVIGVVGVAVLAGLMLAMRPAPRVAPPMTAPSSPASTPTATGALLVHVAGAVRHPGLYQLPVAARVADAIEAAGGPLKRADLDAINLAEVLSDAMKIEVPLIGRTGQQGSVAAPTPSPIMIDLNSADQATLESIPGVGPVTALSIITTRDEIGRFASIDQLLDVDGIGPATLEAIRPYVTI